MSANFSRSLRWTSLIAVSALFAGPAFGQSTDWAPARSTSRPGDRAFVSTPGPASTPDWQRNPYGDAVQTTATRPIRPTTARSSGVTRAAHTTANTQRLAYDVELQPGERIVGEPSVTAAPAPNRGELLPTPDRVSGQKGAAPAAPHAYESDVHLDPGFDFEDGGYMSQGEYYGNEAGCGAGRDCHSCASGDCDSCIDGGCGMPGVRDDWADPTRCPECNSYGYHRPGCGRVQMCIDRCLGPLVREWSIFAGSQGFKGPLDVGQNGNFGFNEGFNLAGPIIPFPRVGLGYQIGARFAQSDLSGTNPLNGAFPAVSSREQTFITAGVFHRAYRGCGLQWGVAFDWLTDNFWDKFTTAQIRAEISLLHRRGHEIGFWGAFGTNTNINNAAFGFVPPIVQADQYNLFYRYTTEYGGQGRIWAGVTGSGLSIFGTDFRVPMSNRFDMVGGFNYIVPNNGQVGFPPGAVQEGWGLSMNLVWYVGRTKQGIHNTPFRPLFNVADNNTMMLEQQ